MADLCAGGLLLAILFNPRISWTGVPRRFPTHQASSLTLNKRHRYVNGGRPASSPSHVLVPSLPSGCSRVGELAHTVRGEAQKSQQPCVSCSFCAFLDLSLRLPC